jgi:hypothetical protein
MFEGYICSLGGAFTTSIANDWQSDFSWSGPGNVFSLFSVTMGIPTPRMRPNALAPRD